MLRRISLLVLALLVLLLAYAFLTPQPSTAVGREQAVGLVLADLKSFQEQGAEVTVLNVRKMPETWAVDVFLVTDPHSSCPQVLKRFYTLTPFAYRPETVIGDCTPRQRIAYREEALIDSGKLDAVPAGARGCAFYLQQFNASQAMEYCPWFDLNAFNSFSEGLPLASWVVQWSSQEETVFIALSSYNEVLKTS